MKRVFMCCVALCCVSNLAWAQQAQSQDKFAEDNQFFKPKTTQTGADIKKEFGKKTAKKTDFKKRIYNGPSQKEIELKAIAKAQENFQVAFPKGAYEIKMGAIEYNPKADVLKITALAVMPRDDVEGKYKKDLPILTAQVVELAKFNLGQSEDTALEKTGEARITGLNIPVLNGKNIKSGQLLIQRLVLTGDFLKALSEQKGTFEKVYMSQLRSEKIINKIEMNNIVKSKIMSASSAEFKDLIAPDGFFDLLKDQSLQGFSFQEALVNNKSVSGLQGAEATLISYSARALDPDMIIGARLESKEKNPTISKEKIKQNAQKTKEELKNIKKEHNETLSKVTLK